MVLEIETIDNAKEIIDIHQCVHFFVAEEVLEFAYIGSDGNMNITMDDSDDAVEVHKLIMSEIKAQISKGGFKCNGYLKIYKNTKNKYESVLSF
jgi:hypothetical protein